MPGLLSAAPINVKSVDPADTIVYVLPIRNEPAEYIVGTLLKTIASLSAIVPPVYEITFDATPVAVLVTYTCVHAKSN